MKIYKIKHFLPVRPCRNYFPQRCQPFIQTITTFLEFSRLSTQHFQAGERQICYRRCFKNNKTQLNQFCLFKISYQISAPPYVNAFKVKGHLRLILC